MAAKPCLNCGEAHDHDGIYCASCRGAGSDLTADAVSDNGNGGPTKGPKQGPKDEGERRELELPDAVHAQIMDVVENNVTYRDEEDFLLAAIRLELRRAKAG